MNIDEFLDGLQDLDHIEKPKEPQIPRCENGYVILSNGVATGGRILLSDSIVKLFEYRNSITMQISADGKYLVIGNPLVDLASLDCQVNEDNIIACTWLVESMTDAFDLNFEDKMFLRLDNVYVDVYNDKPVVVINVNAPKESARPDIKDLCENAKEFDYKGYTFFNQFLIKIVNSKSSGKRVELGPGVCENFSWVSALGFETDADKKYLVLDADAMDYDITTPMIKCEDLVDDLIQTFQLDFSETSALIFEGFYVEPWAMAFRIRK